MHHPKDQFNLFCKIPQVNYWQKQLNISNIINIQKNSMSGTRKCYVYGLYRFNKWIVGKRIKYQKLIQVDNTLFTHKLSSYKIRHIGHFLELYQEADNKRGFVVLIKQYLLWLQANHGSATVDNALYSIKSFFRENDTDIVFRFNNKKHLHPSEHFMTIPELKDLITTTNIQIIEKAVFLCKFHRGLDSSTFADRFNFSVWKQLCCYFETSNYKQWDLKKCPVPIKLIRVKTNYLHTGFLDIDAIKSMQDYLETRMNEKPQLDSLDMSDNTSHIQNDLKNSPNIPFFIDKSGNPISVNWIRRRFHKLQNHVKISDGSFSHQKNQCVSHEFRDLLKSTLIDSGCRPDVADHVIGHSPKDSYEKQAVLYPDSLRDEFSKCSKRINFLTYEKNSSKITTLDTFFQTR